MNKNLIEKISHLTSTGGEAFLFFTGVSFSREIKLGSFIYYSKPSGEPALGPAATMKNEMNE